MGSGRQPIAVKRPASGRKLQSIENNKNSLAKLHDEKFQSSKDINQFIQVDNQE